jgi:hypothetical protein
MVEPFDMKYRETHLKKLYKEFPEEKAAIDKFIVISNYAMTYTKLFLFARLLPKWMQSIFWSIVPRYILATVERTAKEVLPELTSNKRLIALLSSMWIDTGARPDKATFMLTAAVFRGITIFCNQHRDLLISYIHNIDRNFDGRRLLSSRRIRHDGKGTRTSHRKLWWTCAYPSSSGKSDIRK